MEKKPYQIYEITPMTVAEPAVAYGTTVYERSVQAEKELFFAGSKRSMSLHLEKYL